MVGQSIAHYKITEKIGEGGMGEVGFSGDGGPATEASLFLPWGVAVDGAGNLFIADRGNSRIRAVRGPLP